MQCPKCKTEMQPGKAIQNTFTGIPDFIGDPYPVTVSPGGHGRLIDCQKCPECGFSVTNIHHQDQYKSESYSGHDAAYIGEKHDDSTTL